MKSKIFITSFLLLYLTGITIYSQTPPVLTLSDHSFTLATAQWSQDTLYISSNQTGWRVQAKAGNTWLLLNGRINNCTGSNNGYVILMAHENESVNPRSDTLTISTSGLPDQYVIVKQVGSDPFLTVSDNSVDLSSEHGFMIYSNLSWTLTSNADWLTFSTSSGSGNAGVYPTEEKNPNITSRSATIVITAANGATQSVTVIQAAGPATLSVNNPNTSGPWNIIDVGDEQGSNASFDIISNTTWNISIDSNWATTNFTTGSGNKTITLTAGANPTTYPRYAHITITAVGVSNQTKLTLSQTAGPASLSVSINEVSIASAANSTATFSVSSNSSWTYKYNKSWLHVINNTGSSNFTGNGNLTLRADENTSLSSRIDTLTVTIPGKLEKKVIVTQAGAAPTITLSVDTLYVPATDGSNAVFNITSNASWNISSNVDWLSTNPVSGTENKTITLTAIANPYITTRSATITVSASAAASRTITIIQSEGEATLAVSTDTLIIATLEGSTSTFNITSNASWNISSNVSWLSTDFTTGNGDKTITVIADANPDTIARTALISVSISGIPSHSIEIIQQPKAPTLIVPSVINISAIEGSLADLSIASNTSWSLSSNSDWLTFNKDTGSYNDTIIVTAHANPNSITRDAIITITGYGINPQIVTIIQEPINISALTEANAHKIKVYPNPTNGLLMVTFDNSCENGNVEIYNSVGDMLQTHSIASDESSIQLDLSNYPFGIYLVKFSSHNQLLTKIIIKKEN